MTADEFIPCTVRDLPADLQYEGAERAIELNPVNAPPRGVLGSITNICGGMVEPFLPVGRLAVLISKYWGAKGVKLTVGFMESIPTDLRDRILSHMNAWSAYCNVSFAWTQTSPQVRITRNASGYWSYLGSDVLSIPANQPTMCLQGFTMNSPESEFRRVVRHETGHTLGFPHEHLRRELVQRIDPQKAIAYFGRTQGWSAADVRAQVLTPLEESSLLGTPHSDQYSIMCYQLPGSITTDGQPIVGGIDIDADDQAFSAKIYPPTLPPVPPIPPTPPSSKTITVNGPLTAGTYILTPT